MASKQSQVPPGCELGGLWRGKESCLKHLTDKGAKESDNLRHASKSTVAKSQLRKWLCPVGAVVSGLVMKTAAQAGGVTCEEVKMCTQMFQSGVNWVKFYALFNIVAIFSLSSPGNWLGSSQEDQILVAERAWNEEHIGESRRGIIRYTHRETADVILVTLTEMACVTAFQNESSWMVGTPAVDHSKADLGSGFDLLWAMNKNGKSHAWMCGSTMDALGGDEDIIKESEWEVVKSDLSSNHPNYDEIFEKMLDWTSFRIVEKDTQAEGAAFERAKDEWMYETLKAALLSSNNSIGVEVANAANTTQQAAVPRERLGLESEALATAHVLDGCCAERRGVLCVKRTKGPGLRINPCRGGGVIFDKQRQEGLSLAKGGIIQRDFIGGASRSGVYPKRYALIEEAPGVREDDSQIDADGILLFEGNVSDTVVQEQDDVDGCEFFKPIKDGVPYQIAFIDEFTSTSDGNPNAPCVVGQATLPAALLRLMDDAVEANLIGSGDSRPREAALSEIAMAWVFGALGAVQMGTWIVYRLKQERFRLKNNKQRNKRWKVFYYLDRVEEQLSNAFMITLSLALTYGFNGIPLILQLIEQHKHDTWRYCTVFSQQGTNNVTVDTVPNVVSSMVVGIVERSATQSTTDWTFAALVAMAAQSVGHWVALYYWVKQSGSQLEDKTMCPAPPTPPSPPADQPVDDTTANGNDSDWEVQARTLVENLQEIEREAHEKLSELFLCAGGSAALRRE